MESNKDSRIQVLQKDENIRRLRRALLAWYPFRKGKRALVLGTDADLLSERVRCFYSAVDLEPESDAEGAYDCIIAADLLEQRKDPEVFLGQLYRMLAPEGVLLLGTKNRFGLRYLCGGIDETVQLPFSSLRCDRRSRLFSRRKLEQILEKADFSTFFYYPLPDGGFPQVVYSDAFLPKDRISDRIMCYDLWESPFVAAEEDLYDEVIREKVLPQTANYFLVECHRREWKRRPDEKRAVYAALSTDRGEAHGFATVLYDEDTAGKHILSPEGFPALKQCFDNLQKLQEKGILTIPQKLADDSIIMPFIHEEALMTYLRRMLDKPEEFLAVFDRIWEDVLRSSEPAEISEEEARAEWGTEPDKLGTILQQVMIDMIPLNAFYADGQIRYYDQEFAVDHCPALYVMFRALFYTWLHIPQAETVIPLEQAKARFGLTDLWDHFAARENRFVAENRNWKKYKNLYDCMYVDRKDIKARCIRLSEKLPDRKKYHIGLLMGVFDLFHIGHLNLIRRAKEQCEFLRVGVLSDELVMKFKNIYPTIPLKERMEILASVRYVDEVVEIDTDPSRIEEWHKRPFDCFFSGDDYAGNPYWDWEKKELQKLGADIEFFPYTKEQSSSMIRSALQDTVN